jgi:hypothetical protein
MHDDSLNLGLPRDAIPRPAHATTRPRPDASAGDASGPDATRPDGGAQEEAVRSAPLAYIIYSQVTQFNSATGGDTSSLIPRIAIRRVMASSMARTTLLTSNARQLDDLLEDDVFRASVTVLGKMDYDIQIGGYTTVPLLEVNSIKVIG